MTSVKQQVILICYNQQDYIIDCLESIVNSTKKPWKVTVFDDFSTDKTREIILTYQKNYPSFFDVNLNERNLGIFGNLSQIKKHAEGDLIHLMAGDDWFDLNFFEEMELFYINQKLSEEKSSFAIISPFYYVDYSGGNPRIEKKSLSLGKKSEDVVFSDFLQDNIIHRYTGMSKKFFEFWPNEMDEKKSLWWDRYYYLKHFINLEKVFFLSTAYTYYRQGCGVAAKAKPHELDFSYIAANACFLEEEYRRLSKSDVNYFMKSIGRKLNTQFCFNLIIYRAFKFYKEIFRLWIDRLR